MGSSEIRKWRSNTRCWSFAVCFGYWRNSVIESFFCLNTFFSCVKWRRTGLLSHNYRLVSNR
ncbi:hypothetical protein HMPREF3156_01810 [Neisseria sp. HMSC06F02]|nr:hypothetical protein HMPREF3156_01810 [Neisseria sp. HMSC06F02]